VDIRLGRLMHLTLPKIGASTPMKRQFVVRGVCPVLSSRWSVSRLFHRDEHRSENEEQLSRI
jgi:hypothetical protein